MSGEKVGAVLVVGGGISGMQTALDLADSGFKVYLMDNKPSIGGVMSQLDKTFPTNDCSMCIMAPKLVATGRHHNIEVITNSDIEKVEGEPGHFSVSLKLRPRWIDSVKCTGCGACARVCVVKTSDEYNELLTNRSAIYVRYPQAVPLVYAIDRDICVGCGNCDGICKAGAIQYDQTEKLLELDVGSIVLSPGFDEFDANLKKEYGYGLSPNVLSSIEFERILSATGPYSGMVLRPSDGEIPQKVAFIQCVGSRDSQCGNPYCSAVCCMYSIKEAIIAKEHTHGLKPHIFFMDIRAFGKEFDDYYNRAKDEHGINFTRARVAEVTEDPETSNLVVSYIEDDEIRKEEFDLVVLSVGFTPPDGIRDVAEKLGVKLNQYGFCETGSFTPLDTSRPGVFVSGAFSGPKDIPDTVAQASGAAAKASSIIASERGKLTAVQEFPAERDISGQEPRIGVFVCHCGINIGSVVNVPEVVEYARSLPGVVYSENNLYTCSEDTQKGIKEKIEEHNLNRVIVASCTPRTHEPLFQSTTKEGGLNPYLFEMANIRDQCSWVHMHEPSKATEKSKDLVRMAVANAALLEPLYKSKLEVKKAALVLGGGLSGMTAALEIARQGFTVHIIEKEEQLGGNLRKLHYTIDGGDPQALLKEKVEDVQGNERITIHTSCELQEIMGHVGDFTAVVEQSGELKNIPVGVVVVATGGLEYKPNEYLYSQDDRVLTQLEAEERLAAGEFKANDIVMIQCVGSRTKERPYCSRICCTTAIKNALRIKKDNPQARINILYKDVRTYGFKEDYYTQAAEAGVLFTRYDDGCLPSVRKDDGRLRVKFRDPVLGEDITVSPDMLVLSAAVLPEPSNETISKILKAQMSKDRFFLEAHMKLRPVDFSSEGMFLCGVAHSPKFTDECISQACGAASRATTILSKDHLEVGGVVSQVQEEKCVACLTCVRVCPYNVPAINEKGRAEISEAECQGCGICASECPVKAIQLRHFRDDQVLAKCNAVFVEEEA